MVFEEESAFKIDTFIETSIGIAKTNRTYRVEWSGEIVKDMEVIRVPIDLLTYNFDNFRIEYQLLAKERKLGYNLDFENLHDREIFAGLFEESLKGRETKELKIDISKRGQIHSGIITYGGVIINGNRRYVVLKELFKEESIKKDGNPTKFAYMDVIRLPKDLPKKVILEIQAKAQMAKDFKVDYSPINMLLAIRKFMEIGFTRKQIASLLNLNPESIKEKEQQFDLIDEFLEENDHEKEYELIQKYKIIDHFAELRKLLQGHGKRTGDEGKALKKKKDTIKNLVYKWLKNNIDDEMIKESKTMSSREVIRRMKDIVENPSFYDVIEKVLEQHDTIEGKRKVHILMNAAVITAKESESEKQPFYKAERINVLLSDIKKIIDSREIEIDIKDILLKLKELKVKLKIIIKSLEKKLEE